MPISSGNLSFQTGRDLTVVLVGPNGTVTLDNIVSFMAKQITAKVGVDRMDGQQIFAALPKGWDGSIELERANSSVDELFAKIENDWIVNGNYANGQIYTYIQNADGSQTVYEFDGVAIDLSDAGSWKGDQTVKVTISFQANRRRSV